MGARRRSRESALKILFAREVSRLPVDEVIELHWQNMEDLHEGAAYAEQLARGTAAELEELDRRIQDVSTHWKISRMASVDRNILRLAAYELLHVQDVPKRVALNEAIEIAKRFGAEDSWAFINGILDKLAEGLT
jgi:N utilization substance protein B